MLEVKFGFFYNVVPIFLGIVAAILFSKKVLHKDKDTPFLKIKTRQLKALTSTFLGPFVCSFIYSFTPFYSIINLTLFGILSFFISISLSPLHERKQQIAQDKSDFSKIEFFLLLVSYIIPSTTLYLMFLLFFNDFTIPY